MMLTGGTYAEETRSIYYLMAGTYWTPIIEKEFFIAPKSIKKTKAGYVRVWELTEVLKPVSNIRSMQTLAEIDCDDQGIRTVQGICYSDWHASGKSVPCTMASKEFTYSPPGSKGASMIDMVCTMAKGKK
jgi:hypothetical protein